MKRSLRVPGVVGLLLLCSVILPLFVATPVQAQDSPMGIPRFELVKYICPSNVPLTGSTIPVGCVSPANENASNVPVVVPGSSISFIYEVTYRCDQGTCETIPKVLASAVVITDNQLPGVIPTVYGQLVGNGDNTFDPDETWLYIVNNRTAIDLVTQGGTLPQPPIPGCSGAEDGLGSRPTYRNIAQAINPFSSEQDSTYYCNPVLASSISIKKFTNGQDANIPPGAQIPVGNRVEWTYDVTNNGATTLTNVSVTDSQGIAVSCPKSTLAPGESMTCTASGKAVAGQYENIGTVVGTALNSAPVSAADPSHYFGTTPGAGPRPTPKPVPIPEPVTVVLFGTGLAALSAAVATSRKKDD